LLVDAPEHYVANLSFRQLNMIISGTATGIVIISIFTLMARHATHFSKPNEQAKYVLPGSKTCGMTADPACCRIMKIAFMLPMYSVLSWLGIAFPNGFVYLEPWTTWWEAIAIGSFFLLMCEYVSPSADFRDVFFAALQVPQSRKDKQRGAPAVNGLEWYRVR
jgi:hypothetical protein